MFLINSKNAFARPVLHQKKNINFNHILQQRAKPNSDEPVLNNPQVDPDSDQAQQLLLGEINKCLDQYGFQIGLSWLTETAGVVRGGKKKGADYAHQVAFSIDMDWEKNYWLERLFHSCNVFKSNRAKC